MSSLKPLVKVGLSESNLLHFDLDSKILKESKANKLTAVQLASEIGISTDKLAGRRTSLVRRGHLQKQVVAKSAKAREKGVESTFVNHGGSNKEIARTKMANYIIGSGVVGTIPSLSAKDAKIEQKILAVVPTNNFIGVEYNRSVYKQLKKTIRTFRLPIVAYFGKLSDKIYGQSENAYAHIIADYCGCLTNFNKEIEYIFQNRIIQKGGILALTLGIPTRGFGENAEYVKSFGDYVSNSLLDTNPDVIDSEMQLHNFIQNKRGNDFELVEKYNYRDKRTPMTLLILRRK